MVLVRRACPITTYPKQTHTTEPTTSFERRSCRFLSSPCLFLPVPQYHLDAHQPSVTTSILPRVAAAEFYSRCLVALTVACKGAAPCHRPTPLAPVWFIQTVVNIGMRCTSAEPSSPCCVMEYKRDGCPLRMRACYVVAAAKYHRTSECVTSNRCF